MNIIQDFAKNSIKNLFDLLGKELKQKQNFSGFVMELKKELDKLGVDICNAALVTADKAVKLQPNRKNEWTVERKDTKTLLTIFGEVKYDRTYYKSKKTGEYKYLSDEFLGIDSHDRMDMSLKAKLVEEAVDNAYNKSGKKAVDSIKLSSQTVMNSIRELEKIPTYCPDKNKKIEKKKVEYLYVEADEDHVALQDKDKKIIMPRLIYVHEGYDRSEGRIKLKNRRYFSGVYDNVDDLWIEVANYIEDNYDTDNIKKIYISGDGASWINKGKEWIDNSLFLLDRFHLNKYVLKATALNKQYRFKLWEKINNCDLKGVKKVFKELINVTEKESKIREIKDSRRYITRNWEGIENHYNKPGVIGCSAEGHISHILSDRLSSRPLGWSKLGVDQMSRLRAYTANGGATYNLFLRKFNEQKRGKKYFKISKRVINSAIKENCLEKVNNIEVLNSGKKTWLSCLIKNLRSA